MGILNVVKFNFNPNVDIIINIKKPANLSTILLSQNLIKFPKHNPISDKIIIFNKKEILIIKKINAVKIIIKIVIQVEVILELLFSKSIFSGFIRSRLKKLLTSL